MIARKDAAMDAMLQRAEAGDVLSQTNLATVHENRWRLFGRSASSCQSSPAAVFHQQESLKWWRRAADQGSARAQASLALRRENGDGVEQGRVEALMWYLLSEPHLRGDDAERARKGRLQLTRTMTAADIDEAARRAALWQPRSEQQCIDFAPE